jgi:3-oxoacyl-[acyl-carrier protein] reductase
MQLGLQGKRVVIVGASKGLGKVTAQAFLAEGALVAGVARNADILRAAIEDLEGEGRQVRGFAADFTDARTVQDVVVEATSWMGGLDVLVNCAGLNYVRQQSVLDITDEMWQAAFDVCLMATVRACRAAIPEMLRDGGGSIVNISALSSRWHRPYCAQYGALQLAKENYSRNIAKEFAKQGIRSNVVNAGMMRSEKIYELMAHALHSGGAGDEVTQTNVTAVTTEDLARQNQIKASLDLAAGEQALLRLRENGAMFWTDRFADSQEVADVILFLASDRTGYVNGAVWTVDGGGAYGPP